MNNMKRLGTQCDELTHGFSSVLSFSCSLTFETLSAKWNIEEKHLDAVAVHKVVASAFGTER